VGIGAPPKLWAGLGSAQIAASGLLLGGLNDNNREASMTKTRKGRSADPRQADFLALLDGAVALPPLPEPRREAGALAFDQRMRRLLNQAIAAGPYTDRDALAQMVSFHAGRPVTKAMIDSWTGASRPHRFPADLIPAFCAALGNTMLLQDLAESTGCAVTESAELIRSRCERLTLFIRLARAEQRRLVADLPRSGCGGGHG
jgi:hypothetical protein